MKKSIKYPLIFFITICTILVSNVQAFTELCGIIDGSKSLTQDKSPYLIIGDIYVNSRSMLQIESGVEVLIADKQDSAGKCEVTKQWDWLDSNMISIKIDGNLYIKGTNKKFINIKPQNYKSGQIQWYGIRISGRKRKAIRVEYANIWGAQKALWASYSSFNISNSAFIGNNTGIYIDKNSRLNIYNCVFSKNRSAGIYTQESLPNIVANVFYENHNYGIWSDSYQNMNISYNLFHENAEGNCFHCPYKVGAYSTINNNKDSTDAMYNLFRNPILENTLSHKESQAGDIEIITDISKVKDSNFYNKYMEQQKQQKTNRVKNIHEFWPSKYSPLLNAAPENGFFNNKDGSRGDIGISGGVPDRTKKKFSF